MKKKMRNLLLFVGFVLFYACFTNLEEDLFGETPMTRVMIDDGEPVSSVVYVSSEKTTIRKISTDEIPEGVTPIVFESEEELEAFAQRLDSIFEGPWQVVEEEEVGIKTMQTRNEVGSGNSKTVEVKSGDHTINVTLRYERIGSGNIIVTSAASDGWINTAWQHISGSGSWSGTSRIDYTVSGYIKFYGYFMGSYTEVNKQQVTISGTTPI